MRHRRLGRTDWQVSEVGFGMWGMGGQWAGADDETSLDCLRRAVALGCNFFDTAWAYGQGRSERLLGRLLSELPDHALIAATKVPPKNFVWPASAESPIEETFPPDHIREFARRSLANMGRIDLLQLHVWDDSWASDDGWRRTVEDLKRRKTIRAFGISINRWEPMNVAAALRTGLVDTVQVVYNIFDQAPEDELFPLCRELDIGVIARVPFDEGTLTGALTMETRFPEGDWRRTYFCQENLLPSVERAERLKGLLPHGMALPQMALRFILSEPAVSTTIPGMRSIAHVESNLATSDGRGLTEDLVEKLREHRWDRKPAEWSR